MKQERERHATRRDDPFQRRFAWRGGAVSGFVATAATGVVIWALGLDTLRVAVAGLYGSAGDPVVGWVAHLLHGTLFGVLFAAIVSDPAQPVVGERERTTVLLGVVYGVVLAVAAAGIIMPIWLGAMGVASVASLPNVTAPMLAWHVVYGVVLGATFPLVRER